jgi:hypothetical protein
VLTLPDSHRDNLDDGRKGVVGRDVGRWLRDVDRFTLPSRGVVEDDMILVGRLKIAGSLGSLTTGNLELKTVFDLARLSPHVCAREQTLKWLK